MNDSQISTAINTALEIEGLLMLLRERHEDAPSDIIDLLRCKAAALQDVIDGRDTVEAPRPAERPLTLNDRYRMAREQSETPLNVFTPRT